MKISVLGLGYVGAVSAACLARDGHEVIGVDPERSKVDLINAGKTPFIENDVGPIITQVAADGCARPPSSLPCATDLSTGCVGTPGLPNGDIDLKYVRRGAGSRPHARGAPGRPDHRHAQHQLPGTMREWSFRRREASGARRRGVRRVHQPGVLREGTAVHDYYHPPKTVIPGVNQASGVCSRRSTPPCGPMIRTDIETAEMVKYADNAWHALKVGFANEIGNLQGVGVDAHRVWTSSPDRS
jgi:GDP-mannose 6-dehydrogenase